jgi:phage N-6-adenine-methyltransferase
MTTAIEPVRTGPSVNKGRSKQDYGTPWEFIRSVVRRFGQLHFDLAASEDNRKADRFYTEADDSLAQDWTRLEGNLWLNPPFANIAPWAEKCALSSAHRNGFILFLTPASVGANWFADHVHRKALVLGLSPRLTFEGTTDPYPKDLILSVFGYGFNGFDTWRWK